MRGWRLAGLALLLLPVAAPGQPTATRGDALVTELMHYLALPANAKRDVLEKCRALHTGLAAEETLAEEVAAAGAMVLVGGKDVNAVLGAFLDSETFRTVHGASRIAPAGDGQGAAAAHVRRLPDSSIKGILSDPRRVLNVSEEEAGLLRASGAGKARTALAAAFEKLVTTRRDAYANRGLAGVLPYARSGGATVEPARELTAAIRSLALLADDFPGFVETLGKTRPDTRFRRQVFEIEVPFESASVLALSSETRAGYADRAVGADLHFYASQGYNSMLTVIAVVPYGDQWLAFAVNHTFTDAVLGFGTSMKRSIARRRVGETLARHLEAGRARLPATQACRPR